MKPISRFILAAIAAAGLLGCEERAPAPAASSPSHSASPAQKPKGDLRIAVVPKGTTHEFWRSIHAGALAAARELSGPSGKIEITFRGPEKEDDREQQVALVQNLVSGGYDAIVLAPLDDRALAGPVRQATGAGVPVVVIDSGLNAEAGKDFVSYIATDNEKGGQLAGKRLGAAMEGKGKALLLRYQEGSASTALREKGFIDAIAGFPEITVVDPGRYAGATRATAQEAAENLLLAHPDITGVFCPNESSSYGMLIAMRSRGMAGKVKFVGFDASDAVIDAIRKGEMQGVVLQNPVRMGYLGVKTAIEHIRGGSVEQLIDTGVMIVTPENMETAEAKELLNPDLSSLPGGR